MDAIVIHPLNALLYASVLFLIAGGLSLIYGVMRIVNLAHGNFYALGAYATAWAVGRALGGGQPSLMLYLLLPVGAVAAAALGAIIEPTLLRPLYKRAEEYQLLITFGLLLILEDLLRFIWGPYPLSASSLFEALGSLSIGESIYPTYNLVVIVVGGIAAAVLWALIYKTKFGVILRATSQNMRMASALGVNVKRVYYAGLHARLFHGRARRCHHRSSARCCAGHGRGRPHPRVCCRGHRRARKPRGCAPRCHHGRCRPRVRHRLFPEVELAVLYFMAAVVLLIRPAGLLGRA